jgi:hypothetical protein
MNSITNNINSIPEENNAKPIIAASLMIIATAVAVLALTSLSLVATLFSGGLFLIGALGIAYGIYLINSELSDQQYDLVKTEDNNLKTVSQEQLPENRTDPKIKNPSNALGIQGNIDQEANQTEPSSEVNKLVDQLKNKIRDHFEVNQNSQEYVSSEELDSSNTQKLKDLYELFNKINKESVDKHIRELKFSDEVWLSDSNKEFCELSEDEKEFLRGLHELCTLSKDMDRSTLIFNVNGNHICNSGKISAEPFSREKEILGKLKSLPLEQLVKVLVDYHQGITSFAVNPLNHMGIELASERTDVMGGLFQAKVEEGNRITLDVIFSEENGKGQLKQIKATLPKITIFTTDEYAEELILPISFSSEIVIDHENGQVIKKFTALK